MLALAWTPEHAAGFDAVDAALPASFAEQAALAMQIARSREDQQRLALLEDRDRIGRDLHDLVIQRLFAVGLSLQSAARLAEVPDVSARLEQAVDDLDGTIKDIRRTIFALGSMDASTDVQTEIERIVDRAAATLKFRPTLRIEGPVRTVVGALVAPDLLAVLGEALSNASRTPGLSGRRPRLRRRRVVVRVTDDGKGMDEEVHESGLRNMRQRAVKHGGTFAVVSEPGAGTSVSGACRRGRSSVPRRSPDRPDRSGPVDELHPEVSAPCDRSFVLTLDQRAADVVDQEPGGLPTTWNPRCRPARAAEGPAACGSQRTFVTRVSKATSSGVR